MKLKIIGNNALAYDWWVKFTILLYQRVGVSYNWMDVVRTRTELLNQYNAVFITDTNMWSDAYIDFESEEMATLFLLTFS